MHRVNRALKGLLIFYCPIAGAQNLVPNGGFERYNNCPTERSQIVYSPGYNDFPTVTDWVSPIDHTTPDYYNGCSTAPLVSVPYNTDNGYRQPHGGDAYAGMSMFSGSTLHHETDDYREYVQTKLSQPLEAGHTYYISFFVNQTYHLPEDFNIISVDKIGLCLTVGKVDTMIASSNRMYYLTEQPQIVSPAGVYLDDSSKWMKIHGTYRAQGGEEWVTIGRFADSLPINYKLLSAAGPIPDSIHSTCYMYVDDVCVTDMENVITSDTTIHTSSFPLVLQGSDIDGEYLWNTGGTKLTQLIEFPGTYWRITWGDCSYHVDTITVKQENINECLWLPSAFTPNGDGKNDQYGPEHPCYTAFYYYDFSIYNRWGQRIYDADNLGMKWDGKWKGVQQDAGTYFYQLSYTLGAQPGYVNVNAAKSNLHVLKGDFELLR